MMKMKIMRNSKMIKMKMNNILLILKNSIFYYLKIIINILLIFIR